MSRPIVNLIGNIYNRITVVSFDYAKNHKSYWVCRCSCGNKVTIRSDQLTGGVTGSCGCLHRDTITTHGDSNSKEYETWLRIKKRCYDPKHKSYSRYGGRGIKVCTRWFNSYDYFLLDMGRAPSPKHSIDRKDNNGNYEPSNCKWATSIEQANNRRNNLRLTYKGETRNLRQWCDILNLNYSTTFSRLRIGWTVEMALSS
jgi:hypothetical protein